PVRHRAAHRWIDAQRAVPSTGWPAAPDTIGAAELPTPKYQLPTTSNSRLPTTPKGELGVVGSGWTLGIGSWEFVSGSSLLAWRSITNPIAPTTTITQMTTRLTVVARPIHVP